MVKMGKFISAIWHMLIIVSTAHPILKEIKRKEKSEALDRKRE